MTQRFAGKNVVVIGGNSGIGLASAKAFALEAARVIVAGRDSDTLEAATIHVGHSAAAYRCDISDVQQVAHLFARLKDDLGRIDILMISAGVLVVLPIESTTEADWDWVHDINLKGAFFSVQSALPLMSKGASVVLTSSTAAYKGIPGGTVYTASKAGLCALGRSLAAELLDREIRVNVVSPGPTDTPIYHRARYAQRTSISSVLAQEAESVPMKRMGTPEEVAAAVLFLASDAASFVTGIDFLVDGGSAHC